jgi:hypothetical protein
LTGWLNNLPLSPGASPEGKQTAEQLAMFVTVGHTTSVWNNFVLASRIHILLQGTGPWSLMAG